MQVTIEKVSAFEGGAVGNAVDRIKDRVNLKLVCRNLAGSQTAGVGGLADEALNLGQQVADFAQTAFGGADDDSGLAGVVDRRGQAGILLIEALDGDQTGGVIRAAVDLQTSAQSFEART